MTANLKSCFVRDIVYSIIVTSLLLGFFLITCPHIESLSLRWRHFLVERRRFMGKKNQGTYSQELFRKHSSAQQDSRCHLATSKLFLFSTLTVYLTQAPLQLPLSHNIAEGSAGGSRAFWRLTQLMKPVQQDPLGFGGKVIRMPRCRRAGPRGSPGLLPNCVADAAESQ